MENKNSEVKFNVLYPDSSVFEEAKEANDRQFQVMKEVTTVFIMKDVQYPESGGIFRYFEGFLYPMKGFPYPEAIWAVNTIKRLFLEPLRILTIPEFGISLGIVAVVPFKRKLSILKKIVAAYNREAYWVILPHALSNFRMTPIASEIEKMIGNFLKDLGFDEHLHIQFAKTIASIIEYDNVYRYILQDIFTETSKEKLLAHPRKEIKRLIDIFVKRDTSKQLSWKMRSVGRILTLLLLSRRVKLSYTKTLEASSFERLQFDFMDYYHAMPREGYDFGGRSYEVRFKEFEVMHGGKLPPTVVVGGTQS